MDIAGVSVGNRMRQLREAHSWSLSEVSRRANISRSVLSNLERGGGNPTYKTIIALCYALRVRPAALTDGLFDISGYIKEFSE